MSCHQKIRLQNGFGNTTWQQVSDTDLVSIEQSQRLFLYVKNSLSKRRVAHRLRARNQLFASVLHDFAGWASCPLANSCTQGSFYLPGTIPVNSLER